jgi:hypothetical protein
MALPSSSFNFLNKGYISGPYRLYSSSLNVFDDGAILLLLKFLRTREEPFFETLWFKNKETMEKVQNLKSSNTAPSSKTFRDELPLVLT